MVQPAVSHKSRNLASHTMSAGFWRLPGAPSETPCLAYGSMSVIQAVTAVSGVMPEVSGSPKLMKYLSPAAIPFLVLLAHDPSLVDEGLYN